MQTYIICQDMYSKDWVFCHKLKNVLIPISLQRDGNLWYFILRLIDLAELIVWNIQGLRRLVAKKVFGKDSIPFKYFSFEPVLTLVETYPLSTQLSYLILRKTVRFNIYINFSKNADSIVKIYSAGIKKDM